MMKISGSTLAKNCRTGRYFGFPQSRRDFSSSGSPNEGVGIPSLAVLSTVIGISTYFFADLVKWKRNLNQFEKLGKEFKSVRKVYTEKFAKYKKLRKDKNKNKNKKLD